MVEPRASPSAERETVNDTQMQWPVRAKRETWKNSVHEFFPILKTKAAIHDWAVGPVALGSYDERFRNPASPPIGERHVLFGLRICSGFRHRYFPSHAVTWRRYVMVADQGILRPSSSTVKSSAGASPW